jgi:hypothetical protein
MSRSTDLTFDAENRQDNPVEVFPVFRMNFELPAFATKAET